MRRAWWSAWWGWRRTIWSGSIWIWCVYVYNPRTCINVDHKWSLFFLRRVFHWILWWKTITEDCIVIFYQATDHRAHFQLNMWQLKMFQVSVVNSCNYIKWTSEASYLNTLSRKLVVQWLVMFEWKIDLQPVFPINCEVCLGLSSLQHCCCVPWGPVTDSVWCSPQACYWLSVV